ncbi:MAG: Mur ligase family protein, partial [Arenicellales bacterium]
MQVQSDRTLSDWLAYIESVHPRTIDLSLDRPRRVMHQLRPVRPAVVITVAGTNGKGSTAAMLDAVYRAAGYRVGTYTSPHLVQYGERVRINGKHARDDKLCQAFCRVDRARGMIPLTYFEFGTLAALDIFSDSDLDIWILEVGMGGRLDAVNILDPDLAVITSVGMDHEAWLGDSRDAIGKEKAGILRFRGRSVISDPSPPATLLFRVEALDCQARLINRDYRIRNVSKGRWSF